MPKELDIIEKMYGVVRMPTKFFNTVKSEKNLKPAFVYDVTLTIVYLLASYVIGLAVGGFAAANSAYGLAGLAFNGIVSVIFTFIVVGFFHIFVILLGGKGGYVNTYKAFVYPSVTVSLFGLVSLVLFGFGLAGMAAGGLLFVVLFIWWLYLVVKGLSVLHSMGTGRSAAAVLIPLVIVLVIALLVLAIAALALIAAYSAGAFPVQ